MQDEGLCIICMEAPVNAGLNPCGHGVVLVLSHVNLFKVRQTEAEFVFGAGNLCHKCADAVLQSFSCSPGQI